MPPMDGPTTVTTCSILRCSVSNRCWDCTISRIVNLGNFIRGCAVLLLGEVVSPLPMASVHTTKYLFVSSALPGPIRKSRRWWLPVRAVTIKTAFDRFAFSAPCVTYEIAKSLMTSPLSSRRSPMAYR